MKKCLKCGVTVDPKAPGVAKIQRKGAKPIYIHLSCYEKLTRGNKQGGAANG